MNIKLGQLSEEETQLIEYYRQGYRPIWWAIEDFEMQAQELEAENSEVKYDRRLFLDALEIMLRMHDPNFGITWQDVQHHLNYYCLIEKEKDNG